MQAVCARSMPKDLNCAGHREGKRFRVWSCQWYFFTRLGWSQHHLPWAKGRHSLVSKKDFLWSIHLRQQGQSANWYEKCNNQGKVFAVLRNTRCILHGFLKTILPHRECNTACGTSRLKTWLLGQSERSLQGDEAYVIFLRCTTLQCRVNTYNQFDTGVPFGGYKTSGIGREHGEEVLSHYTQVFPKIPSGYLFLGQSFANARWTLPLG